MCRRKQYYLFNLRWWRCHECHERHFHHHTDWLIAAPVPSCRKTLRCQHSVLSAWHGLPPTPSACACRWWATGHELNAVYSARPPGTRLSHLIFPVSSPPQHWWAPQSRCWMCSLWKDLWLEAKRRDNTAVRLLIVLRWDQGIESKLKALFLNAL